MGTSFSSIRLSTPSTIHTDDRHLSALLVTAMLVQAGSQELCGWSSQRNSQSIISDSNAVYLVAPDKRVGEPVEEVGDSKKGHALVGGPIPAYPIFIFD